MQTKLIKKWTLLNKVMKLSLLIFAAMFFAACSSSLQNPSPHSESSVRAAANQEYALLESQPAEVPPVAAPPVAASCSDPSDIRGEGVASDYQQALAFAQKNIAAQIQSSVEATTQTSLSQTEDAANHEIIKSSFEMESRLFTHLDNAQDIHVVTTQFQNGSVKVVACMTRSDAMKPFVLKSKLLQDSLQLYAKSYEGATHPLQKNEIYRLARNIYIQYLANRNVLQTFGSVDASESAAVDEDYSAMNHDFSNFLTNYAIYFTAPENELERSIFSVISQYFNVVLGDCKGGLLLKASSQNQTCKEGSVGIKCSLTLVLTGSSCEGERYFELNANVAGVGKYDESEAMERLNENVQKAEWFSEWRHELDRWRMK